MPLTIQYNVKEKKMAYSLFDAHCDTILKIYQSGKSLYDSPYHVSIKKLKNFEKSTQVFAIFNDGSLLISDILGIASLLKKELKDCRFVTNTKNLNGTNAMLSVEGLGNTPDFTIGSITALYDIGMRIAGIAYNNDNFLCGGIENNDKGLTPLGIRALKEMENINMVLDVSHISDKGFYECLDTFNGKIIATHSNSRAVCNQMRNLTDDQFLQIKNRGGVIGINLYPMFLNGTEKASVTDAVKHIEHFLSLGGENSIGIGADFDGISYTMNDICDVSKMNFLFEELAKLNYSDDIIAKISHLNFENILQNV